MNIYMNMQKIINNIKKYNYNGKLFFKGEYLIDKEMVK